MPPVGEGAAWAQALVTKNSMSFLCGGRRAGPVGGRDYGTGCSDGFGRALRGRGPRAGTDAPGVAGSVTILLSPDYVMSTSENAPGRVYTLRRIGQRNFGSIDCLERRTIEGMTGAHWRCSVRFALVRRPGGRTRGCAACRSEQHRRRVVGGEALAAHRGARGVDARRPSAHLRDEGER